MTPIYKLTRPDRTTYRSFKYEVGQLYTFSGTGDLCGPGYSHAYLSIATAILHNPIHAAYNPAILWRAEGIITIEEGPMKVGCSAIRLLEPCPMPQVTIEQRVAYAIRSAWPFGTPTWRTWALNWLNGTNRTLAVAQAAEANAAAAAEAAEAEAATAEGAGTQAEKASTVWAAEWVAAKAARAAKAATTGPAWALWTMKFSADVAWVAWATGRKPVTMLQIADWAILASDPFSFPDMTGKGAKNDDPQL